MLCWIEVIDTNSKVFTTVASEFLLKKPESVQPQGLKSWNKESSRNGSVVWILFLGIAFVLHCWLLLYMTYIQIRPVLLFVECFFWKLFTISVFLYYVWYFTIKHHSCQKSLSNNCVNFHTARAARELNPQAKPHMALRSQSLTWSLL